MTDPAPATAAPAASPRFDLPEPDAFTAPYWAAAAEGRLLIRRCGGCGKPHHYPREFCPHCWSDDVTWEQASGRATLYTWSVVHRNDLPPFGKRVPYVAAVVDLAEGPRLMTEIVDCPADGLRIGMALGVTFRELTPGVSVPVFRTDGSWRDGSQAEVRGHLR
ncbi:Zn-ribbon domain-containing OB-fold protein [Streptomyces sp. NBC_00144]|uniref:Zn-ribbon domain-containing OB-fold protein n=1 Tax=unclassified Streptomyces TaxID=2593676 RepID=UPI00324E7595